MTTQSEAHAIGPVDPEEPMTVTVTVRPKHPAPSDAELEAMASTPIAGRTYPSREAFARAHGADPADIATVEAFAHRHGLSVAESDAGRRQVVLTGRAADFASAFGVTLRRFRGPAGDYRGTTGEVRLPAELRPVVEAVLGLDDRPAARPRG